MQSFFQFYTSPPSKTQTVKHKRSVCMHVTTKSCNWRVFAVRQRFTPQSLYASPTFRTPHICLRGSFNHSISKGDAIVKRSNEWCNEQGPSLMACKDPHFSNPLRHLPFSRTRCSPLITKTEGDGFLPIPEKSTNLLGENLSGLSGGMCGTIKGRDMFTINMLDCLHERGWPFMRCDVVYILTLWTKIA